MSDFDLTPEEAARLLEDELSEVKAELEDSTIDSHAIADSLMKRSDFEGLDIFTPPDNVPVFSQAEHAELSTEVAGQARAWDIAFGVAKNQLVAADVELTYAQVGLKEAKTTVVHQQIANEGLRLIEMSETGKLIAARTEGVVIATHMQGIKNATGRELVSLEADFAKALIDGTIAKINATNAKTDALLLEIEAKQMKAAGIDGSYEYSSTPLG